MAKQTQVLFFIFLPLILLYCANWSLEKYFFVYQFIPTFDIPMHFLGGLLSARALYQCYIVYKDRFGIRFEPYSMLLLYLLGGVLVIAYVWEVYEQLHDIVFRSQYQGGTKDLLFDIFLGMLGAYTFWFAAVPKKQVVIVDKPLKKPRKTTKKTKKSKKR